jgi:hypothetical protein
MTEGQVSIGALLLIAGACVNMVALFPLVSTDRQRLAFRRLWRAGPALALCGLVATAVSDPRPERLFLTAVGGASLLWCVSARGQEAKKVSPRAAPSRRISTPVSRPELPDTSSALSRSSCADSLLVHAASFRGDDLEQRCMTAAAEGGWLLVREATTGGSCVRDSCFELLDLGTTNCA